ncbi:hypothetical protein [Streptomyces alfalfae]|uniref:hypothetical protein n=1 Tax=Streptomyces alfalfae TaxID=1642299 RepID=UPI002810A500|nr:hypothetical protein [Streptomyces alfalfae]
MSTYARAMTAMYTAAALTLAYSAVQEALHGLLWVAISCTAGAVMAVTAAIRETDIDHQLRAVAVQVERAVRPPYDPVEGIVRVTLASACCETWWTSIGTDHEGACRNAPRSNAA